MKKHLFHGLLAFLLVFSLLPFPTHRARAASFVVDTLTDENDWNCSDGDCSLRDAISLANWNGQADTITFSVSGTITLTLGSSLWVGGDSNPTTIDGGGNITVAVSGSPAFQFVSPNPAVLQNITVQGNAGTNNPLIDVLGGGVTIGPNVTVQNNSQGNGIQFSNNITSGTVTGSVIQNNGQSGILVYDASGITIQNSIIRNNGLNGITVSASTLPATTNLQILGNTITENAAEGINFWGMGGNTVQGNYIGTNSSLAARPNDNSGIAMTNGASGNIIDGNTIGYNKYQNVLISGSGTDNNILRNNIIFSDACSASPTRDNTGIVITNGAQNNTIGPGNRIYCHRFDGIQVVGPGTDSNQIIGNQGGTVTNCTLAGVSGSVIACNGRGISIINEYGNLPFPSVSPDGSTRPNGPNGTTVQRNLIARNNFDGLYSVLSTNTTIGGLADANTFQSNVGNGALIVGSTGTFIGNQVLSNGLDGIRLEPHYGLFSNGRDPATYNDDIVSNFEIHNNTFNNNGGAGIHGLDNEADPGQTPAQLSTNNSFSGNGRARIVQEWFGAVEVLDSANNPVATLSSGAITSSTCGTSYALQTYDGGAWGPSNNGLGLGAFNLTNVGTWFLILGDYVHNNGNYVNCDPHTISASSGALSGNALFSFDGNASTHPVSPDPGIPYTRPNQTVNGRYQVAQVTLSAPPPSALPATGFPMGRITALGAPRVAYRATEIVLEIPSLGVKAPIVGVPKSNGSWDVSWLGNSVGWLEGSAFPTWKGNTVLTGHVWNADNTPGIFNQIKTLKYGDRFYIHAFGHTYIYEVRENTWLWGANRVDKVFKHEELDWVTLLTCEGYNPLTSNYLFRRMVRAVLMEVRPAH